MDFKDDFYQTYSIQILSKTILIQWQRDSKSLATNSRDNMQEKKDENTA